MSLLKKLGNLAGGLGSWLTSGVGSGLNNLTGATSAAKQQESYNLLNSAIAQKYALDSAAVNNQYQKEFAQNAHQWEIQDLKKAGLNPVLSAGGSGASASGGGVSSASVGSAGIAQSGINPFESAMGIWNGYEQALNTGADTERKNAEIDNINQDTILKYWQTLTEMEKGQLTVAQREHIEAEKQKIIKLLPAEQKNIEAQTKYTNERARGHSATVHSDIHGLSFGGGNTHSKTW